MPRPGLLVALLLACSSVVACAGDDLGPGPAGPATALTLPPATSSTTSSSPGGASDDLAACYDGDCEVTVRGEARFEVDPRFDIEAVEVSVADGRPRVRLVTGVGQVTTSGVGSRAVYNDIAVRVSSAEGDTARIEIESD